MALQGQVMLKITHRLHMSLSIRNCKIKFGQIEIIRIDRLRTGRCGNCIQIKNYFHRLNWILINLASKNLFKSFYFLLPEVLFVRSTYRALFVTCKLQETVYISWLRLENSKQFSFMGPKLESQAAICYFFFLKRKWSIWFRSFEWLVRKELLSRTASKFATYNSANCLEWYILDNRSEH